MENIDILTSVAGQLLIVAGIAASIWLMSKALRMMVAERASIADKLDAIDAIDESIRSRVDRLDELLADAIAENNLFREVLQEVSDLGGLGVYRCGAVVRRAREALGLRGNGATWN